MTHTDQTTPTSPGAWSFGLRLGGAWFELPVGGEEGIRQIEAQVDARIERDPRLTRDHRADLVEMVTHFAQSARRRGAALAGLRWELHEPTRISVATLHVTVHSTEGQPAGVVLASLRERIAAHHGEELAAEALEACEVPIGQALRVEFLSPAAADAADMTEVGAQSANGGVPGEEPTSAPLIETVQYWVPVPGRDALLLVLMSTPSFAVAEPLVAEFDEIVTTSLKVDE